MALSFCRQRGQRLHTRDAIPGLWRERQEYRQLGIGERASSDAGQPRPFGGYAYNLA